MECLLPKDYQSSLKAFLASDAIVVINILRLIIAVSRNPTRREYHHVLCNVLVHNEFLFWYI